MSGGHFQHQQYIIGDIANTIRCEIIKNRDAKYKFSQKTINEFRKGIKILKQAEIYADRIDWLLSGDDSENSFHNRLKEELKEAE
jgi:hypothetical protein